MRTERQFRARTLPAGVLNADTLTKTAIELSPDLDVARARVAVTLAALITARQRINPSLSLGGGYNKTPESASTYSVSPALTIETSGKRGYRILEAEKLAEASRIAVYEAEWQVRSRMRAALVNYWSAARKRELLQAERTLRDEIAGIYEKRVAVGEASTPDWNAARTEQSAVSLSLRGAESEVSQALSGIAGVTGLPVSALDGKSLELTVFGNVAPPETLPLPSVQKAGLVHRADIRRSLIEYEAADARLRLVLANQYPNITLSPSYSFQEGFPAYVLGSVIESLPLLHRNRGPIAEQEAVRLQMETQFKALQAKVIGETESALRQYAAAVLEWTAARDTLTALQERREAAVISSFRAGELDRLNVAQARLATLAARRTEVEALIRAQIALGALQDAVQSVLVAAPPASRPEMTN
ncbi:MAG TPA: TolC family protein [Candidatus Acidoferrales bacterium]|nr:TolC family protein [Candidatus Acidoferrales bacterium]